MASHKESVPNKVNEETTSSQVDTKFDIAKEVDYALDVFQSELSKIEVEATISLIDKWLKFLGSLKGAGTKEVHSLLKDFKKMLKGGYATRYEISEALIHIGEQTNEAVADTEKTVKQTVQKLGKQLRKVGTSLAQAEEQEHHNLLDNLLDKVEVSEISSLNAKDATSIIDLWFNLLNKAEEEQFKSIARSLKNLKQALSKDSSKPETIAKILAQVGEQTGEIASQAPRGFKRIIQRLGKRLSTASESLTEKGSLN